MNKERENVTATEKTTTKHVCRCASHGNESCCHGSLGNVPANVMVVVIATKNNLMKNINSN